MSVRLTDPASGAEVRLARAELPQRCSLCGRQLLGELALSTDQTGWVCAAHAERVLMSLDATPARRATLEAQNQLRNCAPGDFTLVTRQLLAAVGVEGYPTTPMRPA